MSSDILQAGWRWVKSCVGSHGAVLFGRNTVASIGVFVVDLTILAILVELADLRYFYAAVIAFLIANSIHYVLARAWIFKRSGQGVGRGYAWFLVNAGVGLAVTMAVLITFVEFLGLHYVVARVIASVFAGIITFLLNAIFNFKELGSED